jgi:hypothetical protein
MLVRRGIAEEGQALGRALDRVAGAPHRSSHLLTAPRGSRAASGSTARSGRSS